MTERTHTVMKGSNRFYVSPTGDGVKLPGVTTILNCLPKGFLGPWSAKMTATAAVDAVGELVTMAHRDRQGAIDYLSGAARRYTKSRGEIGSAAHLLFESMARGEKQERLHPEMQPYADHFNDFLRTWKPKYISMEETVFNREGGWAGSYDAVLEIEGEAICLDYKTSAAVHEETALQLAAYRGGKTLIDGRPMYETTGGAILHITPEGYKLVPARCGEEELDYFRHLVKVFDWEQNVKRTVLGKPLTKGN